MTRTMTLDDMVARHDDPRGVADALRALDATDVRDEDAARCSWLANHVLGEILGNWSEAFDVATRCAGSSRVPNALRNRAVAAALSGRPLDGWSAEQTIAEVTGASPRLVDLAVRLAVLQHVVASAAHEATLPALAACLDDLRGLESLQALGAMVGAALNNTVSAMLDRAEHRLDEPALRNTLRDGAGAARRAWGEAGGWMEQERADYLVALVCNASADWEAALAAAQSGLATIDANGSDNVDRAFLLLEAARAHRGAGRDGESESARAAAFALAASFEDPSLRPWFDERAAA
jgi:hypothetical protein